MEARCCCCCCCGDAERNQRSRARKESRLRRTSRCLAMPLLLLASAALASLFTFLHGERINRLTDSHAQPMMQADSRQIPSAMLTAPYEKHVNKKYLEWESKSGNAFCHGGFNYSDGNLTAPQNGFYRVFLQITYESNQCDPAKELKLLHKVFHFRDSYPIDVLLLSAVDSVNCNMKPWSKSLYTSGVFHLETNSRLHVNSSHPELIARAEHQVFFGAELSFPLET